MSVCAVMLVKDEADVIGPVVAHMLEQVDHVIVADNGSTDSTIYALGDVAERKRTEAVLELRQDRDPAYYQARKTTELAAYALVLGHEWVIPCDADEWWYAPEGRTLSEWLGGIGRETAFVEAQLFNHLPSSEDPPASCATCGTSGVLVGVTASEFQCPDCDGLVEPNPIRRIGWRQRERAPLPKVACRLRPGLEIRQGNHSAWAPGAGLTATGLTIRHYSWRSPEQFVRKVRNGAAAYAATDLPADVGAHWRMYGQLLEEHGEAALVEHFRTWFYSADPRSDKTLIYDPAP